MLSHFEIPFNRIIASAKKAGLSTTQTFVLTGSFKAIETFEDANGNIINQPIIIKKLNVLLNANYQIQHFDGAVAITDPNPI
eukprot:Awhi_evm2s3441